MTRSWCVFHIVFHSINVKKKRMKIRPIFPYIPFQHFVNTMWIHLNTERTGMPLEELEELSHS